MSSLKQEISSINEQSDYIAKRIAEMVAELACEDCAGTGIDVGGLSATEREDCHTCGGSGMEPGFPEGTRIEMYDDNADENVFATILERYPYGWYEVAVDGITDDTTSIDHSLIMRVLPAVERKPAAFEISSDMDAVSEVR